MAPASPIAVPPVTPRVLLDYILTSTSYPTTLLVCSPRAAFLSSLQNSASTSSTLQSSTSTLHLLSLSPHIQTIFTPTLSHLRAWLSVADSGCAAPAPASDPGSKATTDTPNRSNGRSQLVVWGLVNIHQGTSEWSVQGLSSTAAALVEAGQRMGRKVVLVEEAENEPSREDEGDEGEPARSEGMVGQGDLEEINGMNDNGELEDDRPVEQEIKRQSGIYHRRLPMLNGCSKTDANDLEAGAWSGRTVEVGIVLNRWFRFTRDEMLPSDRICKRSSCLGIHNLKGRLKEWV
ncbi:hypothetical protein VC83_06873 [Pseudogymnoascus destructans]|uniref:Uncharacterized protein n=2 Tax=Pseudogymnoascus destructans TaxID=655981 RepID=L8GD78_PSED2|nr:uncharacterized protein VC83_06873 [Pseudogymnoascus destructans]ELR10648.1 hypothetical protein GMDG_04915 [Pseudogymnoascus destructans 20631-21]OAF56386.1 hypothetical protein VC83_06873 [Pseudogymnoascus destructans]